MNSSDQKTEIRSIDGSAQNSFSLHHNNRCLLREFMFIQSGNRSRQFSHVLRNGFICTSICFLDLLIHVEVTTTTSISLSWSVSNSSPVVSSEVLWRAAGETGEGESYRAASTSYTIEGLKHATSYNITVTVDIAHLYNISQSVTATTGKCNAPDFSAIIHVV